MVVRRGDRGSFQGFVGGLLSVKSGQCRFDVQR